jgi:hypothetical protein
MFSQRKEKPMCDYCGSPEIGPHHTGSNASIIAVFEVFLYPFESIL